MSIAPPPLNEAARLRFLESLNILDTPAEEAFDRITRLASMMFDVPMALVSLTDVNRQWFKSNHGLKVRKVGRDIAFCAHALHAQEALVIPNAEADPRFAENPLVVGEASIRFYAGVPLRFSGDLTVGTLCILDTRTRQLSQTELANLMDLARIVEREMLLRSLAIDAARVQEAERAALISSEARFRMAFKESPLSKALIGPEGRILESNREFCELVGMTSESLHLIHLPELVDRQDRPELQLTWQRLTAGARDAELAEIRLTAADGYPLWVELKLSAQFDEDGQLLQVVASFRDISERKHRQQQRQRYQASLEQQVAQRTAELENSQQTLKAIADNLPVLIAHIGPDLHYLFNNATYQQVFGLAPAQLKNLHVGEVLPREVYRTLLPHFEQALAGQRVETDNVRFSEADPRIWHVSYIPDIRKGKVEGVFVMSLDVTERKHREQTLLNQATMDALTGLPNRLALHQDLQYALQQRIAFALYFIDLDEFKQVNDGYGHEVGDLLLQTAAKRMRTVMRGADTVARLAGDEFVVIAQSVADHASARDVARKLCETLAAPFELVGQSVNIAASIGIYINHSGQHDLTAAEVLAKADAAMYDAKRAGRNRYSLAPN
jgi:diguanylate cyclase (GGDEF)-like protein/PAS domain S-box-containing protein